MHWRDFINKYGKPEDRIAGYADIDRVRVSRIEAALETIVGKRISFLEATPEQIDRAAALVDQNEELFPPTTD